MLYRFIVRPIAYVMLRALFALLGGFRVEGAGNVPRQGGVILAPNHRSLADPPLVGVATPRSVYFMAKTPILAVPIIGAIARMLHAYGIRQGAADRAAIRYTVDLLAQGEVVVVFPEGGISDTGRLDPVNPGVVLLAIRAGAPVVPVGLVGTDRMLPFGRFWPRRVKRPLRVRFGQPIPAAQLAGGLTGRAALDHGVEALTSALKELTGEGDGSGNSRSDVCHSEILLHRAGFSEYSKEE